MAEIAIQKAKAERPRADLAPRRDLATLCKAASDSLRIDILRALRNDSFGVQELASIFAMPQPGMSHHLKILAQCGLLTTRREGNSIFYRRTLLKENQALVRFQAGLYQAIDSTPLADEYQKRINTVHKERSLQSRQFFEKNAEKFHEHQGLLCEVNQYFPNLVELLDLIKADRQSRAMEVGPGEGLLLEELSRRFASIVALDNSEEMLTLAKAKAIGKSRKIEFVNSSLEAYAPPANPFSVVVLNMVMHHMPSPAKAFQKLALLVGPTGHVLVADLCSHDQGWTKESCGDLWLGFEPQDLSEWAFDAGFEEIQSSYLGLKNGFQIQLRLFCKNAK